MQFSLDGHQSDSPRRIAVCVVRLVGLFLETTDA